MASFRASIRSPVVKWKRLSHARAQAVQSRLKSVLENPPPGVARLLEFGWSGDLMRMSFERVSGLPLHGLLPRLSKPELEAIAHKLEARLAAWRSAGFVHGDLSTRNLLIERGGGTPIVWAIDWVCDLGSREGTPRFAAPGVFEGKRSFESDRYAIEQILCILSSFKSDADR